MSEKKTAPPPSSHTNRNGTGLLAKFKTSLPRPVPDPVRPRGRAGGGGRGLSSCMHVPAFAQTSLPRCAHIKIVISPVSALADPACLLFPSVAECSSASSSSCRMFRSACFTGSFRRCDRGVPVFSCPYSLLLYPLRCPVKRYRRYSAFPFFRAFCSLSSLVICYAKLIYFLLFI